MMSSQSHSSKLVLPSKEVDDRNPNEWYYKFPANRNKCRSFKCKKNKIVSSKKWPRPDECISYLLTYVLTTY